MERLAIFGQWAVYSLPGECEMLEVAASMEPVAAREQTVRAHWSRGGCSVFTQFFAGDLLCDADQNMQWAAPDHYDFDRDHGLAILVHERSGRLLAIIYLAFAKWLLGHMGAAWGR